ncbi:MAG: hypothetical protein E4H33_00270 [Anaerolineales bacterium]|nr:MAG: hypothetical protein E4H33_00270 [Anaerolineales bacterium]
MAENESIPQQELEQMIISAKRLGIEVNEADALKWLTAIAATQQEDEVVFNVREGVFGHKVTMLDFSPEDLAHFRKMGSLVEFLDIPGKVETALALSGSAAQSKIQTYPGDADYFERVNIIAPTRDEACQILANLIRDKVLDTVSGPTHQLLEIRFGSYPVDFVIGNQQYPAGSSISWEVEQVKERYLEGTTPTGDPIKIYWDDVARDPGWCKMDWVVAHPIRKELVNVSNMLDVTWEAPDGSITPLDGFLDPYFQEIYLDGDSIPIFSKLSQHVSANALDQYVNQLEKEVNKYITKDINYGKAAKRMYNIFRLTGKYSEAGLIRELFDEPASMLYQVWALIRTMDECSQPDSTISVENVQSQADRLILEVVQILEGAEESTVVKLLLNLREALKDQKQGQGLPLNVEAARSEVINIVNNFFFDKLSTIPEINKYMEEIKG